MMQRTTNTCSKMFWKNSREIPQIQTDLGNIIDPLVINYAFQEFYVTLFSWTDF